MASHNFHLDQAQAHYTNALKHPQGDSRHDSADEIRRHLSAAGYDLDDDATYAVLDKGLTKAKFEEQAFIATTHMITKTFLGTQSVDTRNYGGWLVPGRRYYTMQNLFSLLAEHANTIKNNPLPTDTDRYHQTLLAFIMTEYKSGGLRSYFDDLAIDYTTHVVKELQHLTHQVLNAKDQNNLDHYLREATSRAKTLDNLMHDLNKNQQAQVLQRTEQTPKTLKDTRKALALTFARHAVQSDTIPKWEPIFLNYQRALEELDDAGINLNAKSTYKAIGMDINTFWDNYRKQIEWLQGSGKAYGLPKKIYAPTPKP